MKATAWRSNAALKTLLRRRATSLPIEMTKYIIYHHDDVTYDTGLSNRLNLVLFGSFDPVPGKTDQSVLRSPVAWNGTEGDADQILNEFQLPQRIKFCPGI